MKVKRLSRMKTVAVAMAVCCLVGIARADVYADAHLWLRGMAQDANGNGELEKNEFVNSLGGTNLVNASGGVYGGVTLTNELVKYPMANLWRQSNYIHLDQRVVWTNETEDVGILYPANVRFENVLTDYGKDFSFVVRFRVDTLPRLNSTWNWMLNFGYGQDRGVLLGLDGSGTLKLFCYTSVGVDMPKDFHRSVTNGFWYDVGVSVKGSNVTMLSCCDNIYPAVDEVSSDTFKSVAQNRDYSPNLSLIPKTSLVLGGENSGDSPITYYKDLSKNSANATKTFRGDIQNFACWRRALTRDELREAMAWPRLEAFRLGVEDGKANEFTGEADSDGAEPEAPIWKFPRGFAAHESAKIKFVREAKLDDMLPQILRFKVTEGSAMGQFAVRVNGTDVGSRMVFPGRMTTWYVPGSAFLASTQNLITLTRTDSGEGTVIPDAVVLGGSWQLGWDDGRYAEFNHEGRGVWENWVIDSDTRNYRRALLGSGSSATNALFHFSLPTDLAGRFNGRFTWKHVGSGGNGTGSHMTVDYDGVQVMDKELVDADKGKVFTLELTREQLGPGDHTLQFRNGQGTLGRYFSYDYLRFELDKPNRGTFLIVR